MMPWPRWQNLKSRTGEELRHLLAINPSNRLWQMPFAAALASGLPLLIGAYFGHMEYGLISSLGGMVFLYLPATQLSHRMVWLMACGFGMSACYAFGVMSHFFPALMMWVLTFIAVLVTMVCRFYAVGPPGSLFFVLPTAIGAYTPGVLLDVPLKVGLFAMGSLLACLIAFFYSLYTLRLQPPTPAKPLTPPSFDYVIVDSVVIGAFVGISLALAQVLQLERPYWVPVSCIAVIQGMSLRAVWTKQAHRIVGTGIGLLLAWAILMLPLDNWRVALIMMVLAFVIENTVVRHYGLAVIFITPLTILLAEAATLGQGSTAELVHSRLFDTILGCLVGLAGGVCLHRPRIRAMVSAWLRRLTPSRLLR
ncbi:MAG: FUSC family protein [Azoarcus sp.]